MAELNSEKKVDEEQRTLKLMIQLYCKKNHKDRNINRERSFICEECIDLFLYSSKRSEHCPYIKNGTKTFCSFCKTHCYKPEYREKIRNVMKFSGPRIIFYFPFKVFEHLILSIKKRK